MRCDFDEMRWMDGRMDTCREIPDPELRLRIGPDSSAVSVRSCFPVGGWSALFAGSKVKLPSVSGQERQSRTIGTTVSHSHICSSGVGTMR